MPAQPFWFGRARPLLELPVTRNVTALLRSLAPARLHEAIDGRMGPWVRLSGIFSRLGLLDRLTLSPEGMSLGDLQELTRTMVDAGRKVFTLSFHNPSLAPGNTPYVRSETELDAFLGRLHKCLDFFHERDRWKVHDRTRTP